MAPVRRYLRITKYSVLECRIYLDSPALAQSWLLHPRHQTLARVIEAIRPLVLPKLREEKERERMKKKPSKKSRVKDVIIQDDFEVSMFLTETSTRHSLLTKKKHFREKGPAMMQSNASKLVGESNDRPVEVDDADFAPIRLEEESDGEDSINLSAIPTVDTQSGAKRDRELTADASGLAGDAEEAAIELDSDDDEPPSKRRREALGLGSDDEAEEDKKKMAMDVSYEGFAIYGRVLCLVVKRRDAGAKTNQSSASGSNATTGQAKMENWITSTQIPADDA